MRKNLLNKTLHIACLLTGSLYANLVFADWNRDQGFGGFPPDNIDQQIQAQMKYYGSSKGSATGNNSALGGDNSNQLSSRQLDSSRLDSRHLDSRQTKNYSGQDYQPPGFTYYNNNQSQNVPPGGNNPINSRGSSANVPWGNNASNFSAPWNNRGGNRDSGFSFPWGNNGSSFTGPWNNNGSSFSPWGNRGGNSAGNQNRR